MTALRPAAGMISRTFLYAFTLLLFVPAARAQPASPAEFLGYELGDEFTPHHKVAAYVEHLAEAASNVELIPYGTTNEGRPLLLAVVSSTGNMANLESIRLANLHRAGLEEGPVVADPPAIVWLSYNVHGNESVGTEAAMATLHLLTDTSNQQIQSWLNRTVVIVDPCVNPDGRDRYVSFFRQTKGRWTNVRPEAREHAEPWPGGRTNHYYFDLNRDWTWGTQLETRQRLVHYNRWMPHVHVDFHEMGVDSPYYFAPAAEPYHAFISPWQRELQQLMGQNHARHFDEKGWLFFTRQVFDLFYPGYGDTFPVFNGAIGMTYEQGGSGRAGLGITTAEGDTLTLRDRIDHHVAAGLSTIEVSAQNQQRITQEFAEYFGQSAAEPAGEYHTFIVRYQGQEDQVAALQSHLDLLGIQYGAATRTARMQAFSYRTGRMESANVHAGDLVVPAAQPKGVLTSVLFEPEADLADSLSYDITAWALPYAYDLEAYALTSPVDYGPLTGEDIHHASEEAPVAYLAKWESFEDARLLAELLNRGVRVRFSEVPFTLNGEEFGPGTLIITRNAADPDLDASVRAATEAAGQPVLAVSTTLVEEGADFGSSDVPHLKPPRVAIIADPAASAYALGELWHYFDRQLGYPVTLVQSDALPGIHLYNFDVIIMPSGSYNDVLTDGQQERVLDWLRAGGRLIALEGAARFLAGKDGFGLESLNEEENAGDENDDEPAPSDVNRYSERDRLDMTQAVTGAVFRAEMDNTHPLAFGYDKVYYTLKRSSQAYAWLEDGWNVGVVREHSVVSGFAGHRARVLNNNSLLFGVESIGRGEVVYLLDNPIFRGFWYGGRLLLANAVFLTGQRTASTF